MEAKKKGTFTGKSLSCASSSSLVFFRCAKRTVRFWFLKQPQTNRSKFVHRKLADKWRMCSVITVDMRCRYSKRRMSNEFVKNQGLDQKKRGSPLFSTCTKNNSNISQKRCFYTISSLFFQMRRSSSPVKRPFTT